MERCIEEYLTEAEFEIVDLLRKAEPGTTLLLTVRESAVLIGGEFPSMSADQKMPPGTQFSGHGATFDEAWLDMVPSVLRDATSTETEIPDVDVQAALDAWRRGSRPRVIGRPDLRIVTNARAE